MCGNNVEQLVAVVKHAFSIGHDRRSRVPPSRRYDDARLMVSDSCLQQGAIGSAAIVVDIDAVRLGPYSNNVRGRPRRGQPDRPHHERNLPRCAARAGQGESEMYFCKIRYTSPLSIIDPARFSKLRGSRHLIGAFSPASISCSVASGGAQPGKKLQISLSSNGLCEREMTIPACKPQCPRQISHCGWEWGL